jgi:hypothetical protein
MISWFETDFIGDDHAITSGAMPITTFVPSFF